jgi:hypothetical protein
MNSANAAGQSRGCWVIESHSLWSSLALLVLLNLSASLASADNMDYTLTGPGVDITFLLPAQPPTFGVVASQSFVVTPGSLVVNGTPESYVVGFMSGSPRSASTVRPARSRRRVSPANVRNSESTASVVKHRCGRNLILAGHDVAIVRIGGLVRATQ